MRNLHWMFACSFWAAVALAQAQAPASHLHARYRIRTFSTEEGLPQNTVRAIFQTRDAYLWVATKAGLARFDGLQFKCFEQTWREWGVADQEILEILEDATAGLWLVTNRGLVRQVSGRPAMHRFGQEGLPDQWFGGCPAAQGGLWINSPSQLLLFRDGVVQERVPYPTPARTPVLRRLVPDARGRIWIGQRDCLLAFDPVEKKFTKDQEIFGRRLPASRLSEGPDGQFWFSCPDLLLRWRDGRWTEFQPGDGLPHPKPEKVTVDRAGQAWLKTPTGLFLLEDDRFVRIGREQGLTDDDVRQILEDREGNLWIGTGSAGLVCLTPRRILTYTTRDGLSQNDVLSLAAHGTDLYAGTREGLNRFRAGQWQVPLPQTNPWRKAVAPVLATSKDELWFALPREGFFHWADPQSHPRALPWPNQDTHRIRALCQDRSGTLWVGTIAGLFRGEADGAFRQVGRTPGLANAQIKGIKNAPDGSLWVGTKAGGLYHLAQGDERAYTTLDGLRTMECWPVHVEEDGTCWAGTPLGLHRVRPGQVRVISTAQGLLDNGVLAMLEDDRGRCWMSCSRGLLRTSKEALHAVADGEAPRLECVAYGAADGLQSTECNGDYAPSACRTSDGKLWFATIQGVAMVDPAHVIDNTVLPAVVVESVRVDQELVYSEGDALQFAVAAPSSRTPKPKTARERGAHGPHFLLPAGRGRALEIHYTANSFVSPQQVQFKYRLEGYEADWRDAKAQRVALYTNLKPGSYRFQVIAANNHGVWNAQGASLDFTLPTPIHQTWTFYLVAAAAAIFLAAGIQSHRLRVQRRILLLEQEAALAQQRERIARDMHDDLGSSVTSVQLLAELAQSHQDQPSLLQQHVQQIVSAAQKIARDMDEVVWAVNPRNDTLPKLAEYLARHTEETLRPAGIQAHLDIPPLLPDLPVSAEMRHHLFLIVKEALNNVMRHASATRAQLSLELQKGDLTLEVADNGAGFDPAQLARATPTTKPRRHGHGLANIRHRAKAMGGHVQILSQPGHGTRLRLQVRLPLENPMRQRSGWVAPAARIT